MKHAGRINKKLTMAILLALTLGTSLPVYAETVKGQILTKGDWTLEEQLKMEDSKITADKFSLDGSKIPDSKSPVYTSPVESIQSSLEGKNGIEISNLIVQAPTGEGYHASIDNAVELQGSSWAAPVISISGVTSAKDNPATTLNGLCTIVVKDDVHHKNMQNHLKADVLHVNGVTSGTSQKVYGARLWAVDLSPYTEGGQTNVTVENVANTADSSDGTLAFGLGNSLGLFDYDNPGEKGQDIPFVVTGKTQIRNVSSTNGSAVGAILEAVSGKDMDDSHTDFHDLEISDIHGGDLSVGLYGGMGVVYNGPLVKTTF